MLQHKQDDPVLTASRPHRWDETTKQYVSVPYPEPILYPKWLYKEGKQRQAKSESEEKKMLKAGWSMKPPAIPGASPEDDEFMETSEPDPVVEEMESDDLVPETSSPSPFPMTIYMGKRSREVNDEEELKKRLSAGWSKQRSRNAA